MVKKRKARRNTERLKREYELNSGESMKVTIQKLRSRVKYRDDKIEALKEKIKELEEDKRKSVSEVSKLKNREIRKRDTIIRKLKEKEERRREREGRKFKRSIVYKNRWREFEPSASVLSLKKNIEKASSLSTDRSNLYETIQKVNYFVHEYNEEHGTDLTIDSVIALLTFHLVDDVRGLMITSHRFYGKSPHKTRGIIKGLLNAGLIGKKSVWYNLNLSGEVFMDKLEEHLKKGSSEILKVIENG